MKVLEQVGHSLSGQASNEHTERAKHQLSLLQESILAQVNDKRSDLDNHMADSDFTTDESDHLKKLKRDIKNLEYQMGLEHKQMLNFYALNDTHTESLRRLKIDLENEKSQEKHLEGQLSGVIYETKTQERQITK